MLSQHGAPGERHSQSAGSLETGISALQGPRHERVLQHGAPGEGYFCSTGLDSTSLKIFGLKIAHACSAGALHVPPCPPHAPVLVWAGSGPGCSIPSAPLPQHPHLGQYRSSCPRALLFVAIMIFWTCFWILLHKYCLFPTCFLQRSSWVSSESCSSYVCHLWFPSSTAEGSTHSLQ